MKTTKFFHKRFIQSKSEKNVWQFKRQNFLKNFENFRYREKFLRTTDRSSWRIIRQWHPSSSTCITSRRGGWQSPIWLQGWDRRRKGKSVKQLFIRLKLWRNPGQLIIEMMTGMTSRVEWEQRRDYCAVNNLRTLYNSCKLYFDMYHRSYGISEMV